jgi:hypothetical protein
LPLEIQEPDALSGVVSSVRPTRARSLSCLEKATMAQSLGSKKIAIPATDGFEKSQLIEPQRALEQAGATVHVASPRGGSIHGWKEKDRGDQVQVDVQLDRAPR